MSKGYKPRAWGVLFRTYKPSPHPRQQPRRSFRPLPRGLRNASADTPHRARACWASTRIAWTQTPGANYASSSPSPRSPTLPPPRTWLHQGEPRRSLTQFQAETASRHPRDSEASTHQKQHPTEMTSFPTNKRSIAPWPDTDKAHARTYSAARRPSPSPARAPRSWAVTCTRAHARRATSPRPTELERLQTICKPSSPHSILGTAYPFLN